jgi:3',5'-cyclic AMP phosphodiesterase CpdA
MERQMNKTHSILIASLITLSACSGKELDQLSKSVDYLFNQSIEWNGNHPSHEIIVPADDYCILSMADSHVGGTNNIDRFFGCAKSAGACAVVMAGDLTTGRSEDYAVLEKHLPDQDSLPVFPIAGNHDLHFGGWLEFYALFGTSTYLFTVKTPAGSDLFICLDTSGGTLGDIQLAWFITILQTMRGSFRNCFVFTHNNLFRTRHTDGTNLLIEELDILLGLCTEYQVNMVISGHDHQHGAELFGTTTYLVMDALKDGLSNAGYCKIRIKKGHPAYSFEKI